MRDALFESIISGVNNACICLVCLKGKSNITRGTYVGGWFDCTD